MVAIVDYGLGNLGSIANMLRALGERPVLASTPSDIEGADKLVLPGVGSFDAGMLLLEESGLKAAVVSAAERGKPLLGICLGMQMLGRSSEEGTLPGLGLVPFDSRRFRLEGTGLRVPHMGWDVAAVKRETPLTKGLPDGERYYFVHSYYAACDREENVLMTCDYGCEFAAAVVSGNVYGVQFHPEKSHNFGMRLMRNFVEVC